MSESKFTQDLADEICERVIEGETLRQICAKEAKKKKRFSKRMLFYWLKEHQDFRDAYEQANEIYCWMRFEQAVEQIEIDIQYAVKSVEEGGLGLNHNAAVNYARTRFDAVKWELSKRLPRKYGDKVETTLIGDTERPVQVNLSNLSEEDLTRIIKNS